MKRPATAQSYAARLSRVTAHIDANLDARLDLEALAAIACFSPFHFHRIYRAVMGETVGESVTRLRLHRAAIQLLTTATPIAAVAKTAGYGSSAAFGRAFAAGYAATPAAFRHRRDAGARAGGRAAKQESNTVNVVIQDRAPMRIAAIAHRGPYNQISRAFERLYAWAGPRGVARLGAKGVAIFFDDVRATAPADLRSEAGITVGPEVTGEGDIIVREVPGGRHAMLLFKGPYAQIFSVMGELYGWLATSGEEPADAPQFEVYLNDPHDTAPADLLTEICLPLMER